LSSVQCCNAVVASFDKLRMRDHRKWHHRLMPHSERPHPELVEGRTLVLQPAAQPHAVSARSESCVETLPASWSGSAMGYSPVKQASQNLGAFGSRFSSPMAR